jgi:putative hydrolase of the HAD superfamily
MTTAHSWALADYNGVIGLQPGDADWAELARISGWSPTDLTAFRNRFWQLRDPYDRGALDAEAFWTQMGCPAAHLDEAIGHDTRMWLRTDPEVLDHFAAARAAGTRLALLSNAPAPVARAIETSDWAEDFEILRFSCDLQANKPQPHAYEATLADMELGHLGRRAVLMIDDRAENIHAARALGLHGHHHTGPGPHLAAALHQHRDRTRHGSSPVDPARADKPSR